MKKINIIIRRGDKKRGIPPKTRELWDFSNEEILKECREIEIHSREYATV